MVRQLFPCFFALLAAVALAVSPGNTLANGPDAEPARLAHFSGHGRPTPEWWQQRREQDALTSPDWLPAEVFGLVDEGLYAIGLHPGDLDFDKRVAGPQLGLLQPVKTALDKPLSLPKVTDELVSRELDPWVVLGADPAAIAACRERLATQTVQHLYQELLGEVPDQPEQLHEALIRALNARNLSKPTFHLYRADKNSHDPGPVFDHSELTHSLSEFQSLMILFACLHEDLLSEMDRLGGQDVVRAMTLPAKLLGDQSPVSQMSPLSPEIAALRFGEQVVFPKFDARVAGVNRTLPEVWLEWERLIELVGEEINRMMGPLVRGYGAHFVELPKMGRAFASYGIDVTFDVGEGPIAGRSDEEDRAIRVVVAGLLNDQHRFRTLVPRHGPNARHGQPTLLVDMGGSDTYGPICAVAHGNLVAVIDYGPEGDTYLGGPGAFNDIGQPELDMHPVGPCAAFGGSAILIDQGGNDRYTGGDFSLGAAWMGYARLVDKTGSDSYTGGQFTQGAAAFGVAELLDLGSTPAVGDDAPEGTHPKQLGSNDNYSCSRFGQGFGYLMGIGRLEDTGGNDRYYAGGVFRHTPLWPDRYQSLSQGFGFGSRRDNWAGGIGLLVDRGAGNDGYEADIYGQGSSYWYSLGIAWDEGGNDTYRLGHYGQGAGIHLAAGILVNFSGEDTYTNYHGVGMGGAHDYAVGWLIDLDGNDHYHSNGVAQGLNNSVAILYDKSGDDTYSSRSTQAIGFGTNNSIALLIDGGGSDRHTVPVAQGSWYVRGENGILMDLLGEGEKLLSVRPATVPQWNPSSNPVVESPTKLPSAAATPESPKPGSNPQGLDEAALMALWAKACEWEVGTPENIQSIRQARNELVEEGALDFLLQQLHHEYPLELRALWGTVPHFGSEGAAELMDAAQRIVNRLPDSSRNDQPSDEAKLDVIRLRNAVELLTRFPPGEVTAEDRERCLEWARESASGREKLRLLTSMARWSELDLSSDLAQLLRDSSGLVRKGAAEALARTMATGTKPSAKVLDELSWAAGYDRYFAVRRAASDALGELLDRPNHWGDLPELPPSSNRVCFNPMPELNIALPEMPESVTLADHATVVRWGRLARLRALKAALVAVPESGSSHAYMASGQPAAVAREFLRLARQLVADQEAKPEMSDLLQDMDASIKVMLQQELHPAHRGVGYDLLDQIRLMRDQLRTAD